MRPIKESLLSLLAVCATLLCYVLAITVFVFNFGDLFRPPAARDNPWPSLSKQAPNLSNLNPDHSIT